MKNQGNTSFLASVALIGAPVAVLLVIGFAGLASMRKAVLTDARVTAQGRVDWLAERVKDTSGLEVEAPLTRPLVLPVPPATSGPDAASLEGAIAAGNTDELARLALSGRGFTASGLPVRTLASLVLLDVDPSRITIAMIKDLWSVENPSMLTERWVQELENLAVDRSDWELSEFVTLVRLRWDHDEEIRNTFCVPGTGEWSDQLREGFQQIGDDVFWVMKTASKSDPAVQVMTSGDVLYWMKERTSGSWETAPEWMELSATAGGRTLTASPELDWRDTESGGKRLASASSRPFTFVATLESPDILFAPMDGIARVVKWMMLGAALSAALGLFLAHRSLRRERKLNELKSHFVSSVSHELRAPVGSMRLMADALDQGTVNGSKAKEFHRLMSREGARLSAMIENVLDFARIEQGKKTYKFSETDIEELVQETVQLMAPLAGEKNVVIEAEIDTPSTPPAIDADAIQQALINLIDNAVKFSPDGETVNVRLGEDTVSHDWVLSVSDRGPGIPEESREVVFERFHRLGNELRRETQGAGIGLSLVKHVADGHGGQVKVAGNKSGATLEMRIPFSSNGTNSMPSTS